MRILHRNLLLPLRSRILEDESPPPAQKPEEPEYVNQSGPMEEPIQKNQSDFSEDEQDSNSVSEDDEDQSVPTRPSTRSQGPPPALVGTKTLSKCTLSLPLSLEGNQEGGQPDVPIGYTGRVIGWASTMWDGLHQILC